MSEYKRLTNNNLEEYDTEYDFCVGCKYFGEPNGCNRPNGTCDNYERFIETYNRLAELEDKIMDGEIGDITELNKSYRELSQERDYQIYKQENFAKQQGFTPDATPYYIALQYKRRAEAAEARLKELREKNNG